jgi:hypothetical protein
MAAMEVQKIACVNNAGFVMNFQVAYLDEDGNTQVTDNSGNYPIDQTRTIDLAGAGIEEGSFMWPHVHAVLGITKDGEPKVKYAKNGHVGTYEVKGTTLIYSVNLIS